MRGLTATWLAGSLLAWLPLADAATVLAQPPQSMIDAGTSPTASTGSASPAAPVSLSALANANANANANADADADAAPAAIRTAPLTLRDALVAARDNLDVAVSRGALAAARSDVLAANHAPLPTLGASAESIDLKNGIGGGNLLTRKRIDKKIGIDWTIERGGKRAFRTAAARSAADAADADVQDMQLQQLQAALGAYYDLLAAQERVAQLQEIERSAGQLSSTAARRVQAGDLPAQDAARTEIETQRAHADVQQAQLERQRAAIALAQAIDTRVSPLLLRATGGWPALPASVMADADYTALADARPDVRAATARVRSARSGLDNAAAMKKGDVTVGASYENYPGFSTRLFQVRASIPLQWGYAYQGEIGRAQALLTQSEDALERARRDGTLELRGLQQAAITAEQRVRSYDEQILTRAVKVADGAELAYRRGAIALVDVLDARRTLRTTQIEALAARADYAKTLGAWQLRTTPEALVGP